MAHEEQCLVEQARAGSREAFGELVVLYQRHIYGYVLRIVGDAEAARDVAQEVALRAYTSIANLRDARKFRSWLFTIAVNVSRNWLKRHRRAPLPLVNPSFGAPAYERELPDPNPSASPSYAIEKEELRAAVTAAVQALPLKYREALVLRSQHGLKVDEVADILHITVAAADSRLRRARAMLREKLADLA